MKIVYIFLTLIAITNNCYCKTEPFNISVTANFKAITKDKLDALYEQHILINSQEALNELSQFTMPVNEHFWEMKVVKAETIKKNGQHILVSNDKIIPAVLPDAPMMGGFSADMRTTTIIFPDVEIGDTLHLIVEKKQISPIFPDGFSIVINASPEMRYKDYTVNLDAPTDMDIQVQNSGFSFSQKTNQENRKIQTWKLTPQDYERPESGAVSPFDRSPHLIISSFDNWDIIAKKFYDIADPMSYPTNEIQSLANQITLGVDNHRDQVRAIFDWVSKNIRYFNVALGDGGYIPHAASTVFFNKYGDCKDHVTLMRALLKAKNIDSSYVFISFEPYYRVDLNPTPMWFNHIILYIPELNIYTDPTSMYTSFDNLLPEESSKPILLIEKNRGELLVTPTMQASRNKIITTADFYIDENGKLKGIQEIAAAGAIAAQLRKAYGVMQKNGNGEYVKHLLNKQRLHGSGEITNLVSESEIDHSDPFKIKLELNIDQNKFLERTKKIYLPYGVQVYPNLYDIFIKYYENGYKYNFPCPSEGIEQAINFYLPEKRVINYNITESNVTDKYISYSAKYEYKNNIIHIERKLYMQFNNGVCSNEMISEMYKDLIRLRDDFKSHQYITIY